jgi:hypothetical protein
MKEKGNWMKDGGEKNEGKRDRKKLTNGQRKRGVWKQIKFARNRLIDNTALIGVVCNDVIHVYCPYQTVSSLCHVQGSLNTAKQYLPTLWKQTERLVIKLLFHKWRHKYLCVMCWWHIYRAGAGKAVHSIRWIISLPYGIFVEWLGNCTPLRPKSEKHLHCQA